MRERVVVHVGYQKTGSTWLQDAVFSQTPGLFLIPRLAVIDQVIDPGGSAFDPDRSREVLLSGLNPDASHVVMSHEWLIGHPFGVGYDTEVIARRLNELWERPRVLIVIRRQDAMLRSQYGEWVRHGGSLRFSRYVAVPSYWRWHPGFRFEYLEYDVTIRLFQRIFGKDQVVVACHEALQGDADGFVAALGQSLDLPELHMRGPEAIHRSLSPLTLAVNRQMNRVVSTWGHNPGALIISPGAHGRLGRALRKADRFAPTGISARLSRRENRGIAAVLEGRYGESNSRTAELTGLPLQEYGYELA